MRITRGGGALIVAIVLALTTVAAGPGSAVGDGAGGPTADAAKKCKKKKGKKKKCKKPRAPAPLLTSKVRATLTWSSSADLDVHAWDQAAGHVGYNYFLNPPQVVSTIPNAQLSGDDIDGLGPEFITDFQWYEPPGAIGTSTGNRALTFSICQNSDVATQATLVFVDRLGVSTTRFFQLNSSGAQVDVIPTGGFNPSGDWCPDST